MDTIDRAAEYRRLTETYRQMSDEELTHIAEEAYQLTELAQRALQTEVTNRRLDLQLQLQSPDPDVPAGTDDFYADCDLAEDPDALAGDEFDPDDLGLVPFRRVWDMQEARTAKWVLNNSGIACFLGDDNIEDLDQYNGSFEGGVDMKVREADMNLAIHAVINNWPKPTAEEQAQDELAEQTNYDVRCPRCHEKEIVFDGRDGETTGNEAFHAKFKWHCPSCHHAWLDDGLEKPV